jgi:hypothetical protein
MTKLNTLNSVVGISLAIGSGMLLPSCNDQSASRKSINDLNYYVQQHRDSVDSYVRTNWDSLDSEYQVKKAQIAKDTGRMSQVLRDSFYMVDNNWQTYKQEYQTKAAEKQQFAEMDNVRKALTLDGIRLDYADLKSDRVVEQYQHFVEVVKANKDTYTKEQWLVVNISWKALNGRKKEINKDIASGDEGKITKLKLEYTGVKAANRPFASSEEEQ